jgi:hypothetical protein
MKTKLTTLLATLLLTLPAAAQGSARIKQELRNKETAAKNDPDALFATGKWAYEQGLTADAKRIFAAVLKQDANHAGANEALGNVLVDGKWLKAKDAEELRKKSLAAEYAQKGFVDVGGVWVEPAHAADAKKGIFHHGGERVTREEKLALLDGRVRHPQTGQLIEAKHLEKAQNGYFPIRGGAEWVDAKGADEYYGDPAHPWVVRTAYASIISTLPLAQILELKSFADQGHERVAPLFLHRQIDPTKRPVILVASSRAEYQQLGTNFSDGADAAGSFLMAEGRQIQIPGQGPVRATICENEKNWGTRYVRHSAALAYAHTVAEEAGVELPAWFLHGCASLTSRFQNDSEAGWFGKQHVQKGGVGNLKAWFVSYEISGDMQPEEIGFNLYQAGLMLSFAMDGNHAKVKEAMLAVSQALGSPDAKKGAAKAAIEKLQAALTGAEEEIKAHLAHLISKSP